MKTNPCPFCCDFPATLPKEDIIVAPVTIHIEGDELVIRCWVQECRRELFRGTHKAIVPDLPHNCGHCGKDHALDHAHGSKQPLFLSSSCHPGAPLIVEAQPGNVLRLRCYIPACAKDVAFVHLEAKPEDKT